MKMMSINMQCLFLFQEHGHTPYVVLLLKYLNKWKAEVGLEENTKQYY